MSLKIMRSTDSPKQAFLKVALYGKPGGGKTLTSLIWAEELAKRSGKRILMFDTELGSSFYRMSIPARQAHPEAFDFDFVETKSLMDVLEGVESFGKDYGVVILDSISHLWESAMNAYSGKKTSIGGIPIQAWGQIKRPWKRLISDLLDGDFHVILCGREGVIIEENEEGDMKVTGAKMKSEAEAPYEPHILGRMVPERQKDGTAIIKVFFEKDRSGVLAGKTFSWPTFETIEPVVSILTGTTQPKIGTPDQATENDVEKLSAEEDKTHSERTALFESIRGAVLASTNLPALQAAWELTKGKKMKLGDESMEQLTALKDARKAELMRVAVA